MQPRRWAADTISRWFAMNIVIAVVVAAVMNTAFVQLAGVWARPGIRETGVVDQAAAIARVIDGAPRSARPALARAAGGSLYTVHWFADDAALPMLIDGSTFHSGEQKVRELIERPTARVLAVGPGEAGVGGVPAQDYALAIELADGSWLEFIAPVRSWGFDAWVRNLLTACFVLTCSLAVAALASRRLARPMEKFARQARRFGTDVHAPPMQSGGPLEFRMAAQAFNEMQAQVQRFVADRTDFLAAISHDLRAPLTRMRLRGEFIEDEDQQRKLFRDVDEMQAMVNSSLDFFRNDGELEEATRFNLSELLDTVLDDFRDAGADVVFRSPLSITYVGRPLSLRRAFTNLVDNAIKYGGQATVTVHEVPDGVEVRVEDRGPGIAAELQDEVFRPFYRIETSRNRDTGGVGLGLAAVRTIVRGHGGDVTLRSVAPAGLRATVRLPVAGAWPYPD